MMTNARCTIPLFFGLFGSHLKDLYAQPGNTIKVRVDSMNDIDFFTWNGLEEKTFVYMAAPTY